MKKVLFSVLAWPVSLVAGWFATSLSERYAASLADIDFDLGDDDA